MESIKVVWANVCQYYRRVRGFFKLRSPVATSNRELAFHLGKFVAQYQLRFDKILQKRIDLNPTYLYHFFHTPTGEELLTRVGTLVRIRDDPDSASNSQAAVIQAATELEVKQPISPHIALRQMLIQALTEPEALSVLDLWKKVSPKIQLNPDQIVAAVRQVELLLRETKVMVREINKLAAAEAAAVPPVNFSTLLDIRELGDLKVRRQTLMLQDESRDRHFRVILYSPQRCCSERIPVVVISHGLGSSPEDFSDYAEHLASYGYVVAVPQHPGSDATQLWEMLMGTSPDVFKLKEFVDRPLDVTCVLNELERLNPVKYQGRLNLQSVGVMGHSFGGYTALALAGAEMDFDKLESACGPALDAPNLSLLLQCHALRLPRKAYSFRDRRVAAVLPVDLVGSEVFGPKGIRQIQVPVLMIAGSEDQAAPAILEQIRVFPWFATPECHLALIKGKAHFGNFSKLEAGFKLALLKTLPNLTGPNSTIFNTYAYAISLAFFELHLAGNVAYRPYLQSSYATYISQAPFELYLICQQSAQKLAQKLERFEAKLAKLR